jgi:hypothetical protein
MLKGKVASKSQVTGVKFESVQVYNVAGYQKNVTQNIGPIGLTFLNLLVGC